MSEMQNGKEWNEARMLVLNELTSLNKSMEEIKQDTSEIKESIVGIKSSQKGQWVKINEIDEWKEKHTQIITDKQTEELVKDVEGLKTFKTQQKTILAIAYVLIGFILTALGIIFKI